MDGLPPPVCQSTIIVPAPILPTPIEPSISTVPPTHVPCKESTSNFCTCPLPCGAARSMVARPMEYDLMTPWPNTLCGMPWHYHAWATYLPILPSACTLNPQLDRGQPPTKHWSTLVEPPEGKKRNTKGTCEHRGRHIGLSIELTSSYKTYQLIQPFMPTGRLGEGTSRHTWTSRLGESTSQHKSWTGWPNDMPTIWLIDWTSRGHVNQCMDRSLQKNWSNWPLLQLT